MQHRPFPWIPALGLVAALATTGLARQDSASPESLRQWIAPTARARAFAVDPAVQVTRFDARVRIQGRVARTTVQVSVTNPGGRPAEAELLLPVPAGAAISGFDFDGPGRAPSARLLPAPEARRTYDEIVRRLRDPALLEFAGQAAVRSSVFPVPAGGTQAVRLTYEETLTAEGARVDYELLRSIAIDGAAPFTLTLEVAGDRTPAAVYSPTHELRPVDGASGRVYRVTESAGAQTGTFRCSLLAAGDGLQASVIACPDPEGEGGTFLFFAGLGIDERTRAVAREVTLVLDRSGSMRGEKFEQAREAALQVLAGLPEGDSFRIIDYSDTAESSGAAMQRSPESLRAARDYLAGLTVGGGTNVEAALLLALEPAPASGRLPVVLFLTDGRPTVGLTEEPRLRAALTRANAHARRVFPFGVGNDVNAPLLDALALSSRATSTYVAPDEDIELAVASVSRRLEGPLATDLSLAVLDPETGEPDATAVREVMPRELPDLYSGEQLVVAGRYTAARTVSFALRGRTADGPHGVRFTADLGHASARNDFVPRIWASRRIGELSDAIRQAAGGIGDPRVLLEDPRTKELAEESVRLSVRYGVLSEFTSFLALEGTSLASWEGLTARAGENLAVWNVQHRWGAQAVDTARNTVAQRQQLFVNNANVLWQGSQPTPMLNVQVLQRSAYFQRGDERIEGRLLEGLEGALPEPDETVVVGSEAYLRLVDELAEDQRADVAAYGGNATYAHRGRVIRQLAEPAPSGDPR